LVANLCYKQLTQEHNFIRYFSCKESHNWRAKQLETTWVTLSYKATVVLRWYVSGPKVMVVSIVILNEAKHKTFQVRGFHCETNTDPCVFSLCYFFEMPFIIFDLLSRKDSKFGLTLWLNLHSPHVKNSRNSLICRHFRGKWKAHVVEVHLRSQFRKKPLKRYGAPWTQYRRVEIHSNFFDYLVIFRHYFTGNGKVSCILTTISDWFPNIKI